ncbi:MAG: NAD(P)H-hydrate epimerase [Pseudomonadota bacterium]|nr:NAD(P)H-hydrate epimerase [Pseudomonadota bacterium]
MPLDQTSPGSEIFTTEDIARADRLAINVGISSLSLVENAGRGVARQIIDNWAPGEVAIMCGKGNNGWDGFVVARYLIESG